MVAARGVAHLGREHGEPVAHQRVVQPQQRRDRIGQTGQLDPLPRPATSYASRSPLASSRRKSRWSAVALKSPTSTIGTTRSADQRGEADELALPAAQLAQRPGVLGVHGRDPERSVGGLDGGDRQGHAVEVDQLGVGSGHRENRPAPWKPGSAPTTAYGQSVEQAGACEPGSGARG